jgi:hypothetical protein
VILALSFYLKTVHFRLKTNFDKFHNPFCISTILVNNKISLSYTFTIDMFYMEAHTSIDFIALARKQKSIQMKQLTQHVKQNAFIPSGG